MAFSHFSFLVFHFLNDLFMFYDLSRHSHSLSFFHQIKEREWPGALVQLLWEETHVPKAVCSNPSTVYWMNIFSHLFVV